MQATIHANRKYYDQKMNNLTEDLIAMLVSIMDQIKISNSSLYKKDPTKSQDPNTVVLANKKAPPLEGGNYKNIGGMWTIKHDISSQKFYGILINTELKVDTTLDLNNF